jgi:hypothetical protein
MFKAPLSTNRSTSRDVRYQVMNGPKADIATMTFLTHLCHSVINFVAAHISEFYSAL